MRILLANCKIIIRRGADNLVGAILIFWVGVELATRTDNWWAWAMVVAGPFAGMGILNRMSDIGTNRASFCLPGYRESLRGLLFGTALVVGLLFVLLWFLLRSDGAWPDTLSHAIGSSLVGVTLRLCTKSRSFVAAGSARAGLLFYAIPVSLSVFVCLCAGGGHPLTAWIIATPACLVICAFIWRRLGDMDRVQKGHRFVIEVAQNEPAYPEAGTTLSPSVERLFLRGMDNGRCQAIGCHVWGALYRVFGPILSCGPWPFMPLLVSILFLGYLGKGAIPVAFLVLGGFAWAVALPLKSDVLLPTSRKQEYWASIVVTIAESIWLTAAGVVIVSVSRLAVPVMPHVFGWDFAGVNWVIVAFGGMVVPWVFAVRILDERLRLGRKTAVLTIVGLSLAVVFLLTRDKIPQVRPGLAWWMFVGVTLIGWGFFLLILHRACTRWDLVKPRAGARV